LLHGRGKYDTLTGKVITMKIRTYDGTYDDQIISLILGIQNGEAGIGLSLGEQPDLLDIRQSYQTGGGEFWLALEGERVIGTIGLMRKSQTCAVLKKFFVQKEFRAKGVGLALYRELLAFARQAGIRQLILDTPSVAEASHRFYERAGFRRIQKEDLPVPYVYPDRESLLYLLKL